MTLPGFENIDGMTKRAVAAIPKFLSIIRTHYITNPILSRDIEAMLTLHDFEVRAIVSGLRIKDHPIGSGNKGYFCAQLPGELETTIKHIRGRKLKLGSVEAGVIRAQTKLQKSQRSLF